MPTPTSPTSSWLKAPLSTRCSTSSESPNDRRRRGRDPELAPPRHYRRQPLRRRPQTPLQRMPPPLALPHLQAHGRQQTMTDVFASWRDEWGEDDDYYTTAVLAMRVALDSGARTPID